MNECLFWPTELRSLSSSSPSPGGVENRTSLHRTLTPSVLLTDTVFGSLRDQILLPGGGGG